MLFKRHSAKNLNKKALRGLLESRNQEKCVFFQNPIICFGQLQNYFVDDLGLELTINPISVPGLEHSQESILLSSALEDLALLPAHLISYEQGWHLFFKSEFIEEIRQTAMENEFREDKLLQIMESLLNYLAKEGK